jgi:hypothetical protein
MLCLRQSWAGLLSQLSNSWTTCLLNSRLKLLWFLMAVPFLALIIGYPTLPNPPNLKCPVSGVHSTLYQTYVNEPRYYEYTEKVNYSIKYAISLNEADIGIEWRDGAFWNSGAKLLDEALVNENLKWLTDKGYTNVLSPFEKGLRHFLEAKQKPERLNDTITDIYEAVEALVRIVMENNKDLSKNCESFINKLKLSEYYKKMLDEYLRYANHYSRHAAKLGERKKLLLRNEVEAFIYTSGLFIRLAVQQMTEKSS